jgi:hypothetical protein
MAADLKDPDYWRFRAEGVLSIAEELEHEDTKAIMRRIADDYERIAQMVEAQRDRDGVGQ